MYIFDIADRRVMTYSHTLPARDSSQGPQGAERAHRTEGRDVGDAGPDGSHVDQR